jgi:Carboxypeptidase regulatory-like domain
MSRWWTSRWFVVPTLMLATVLGWMLYARQHDNGLIEGRVVDAQGRPVPGATIRIFDRGFVTHQERGRTQSDAQGKFRITDNKSHSVQLEAETAALGRSQRFELRLWFAAQDARLEEPLRLPAAQ